MESLRPASFSEFVGQYQAKAILQTAVLAARQRGDVIPHTLFTGPPGLGKTSLAAICAREMGGTLKVVTGPNLERRDIIPLLRSAGERAVIFIDEAHAMAGDVMEMLYQPMEDFTLPLQFGSRVHTLALNKFTLIAASTKPASIAAPLRSRFPLHLQLDFYSADELAEVVRRAAVALSVGIDAAACEAIGRCSRGCPRTAINFLRCARDLASVRRTRITVSIAEEMLHSLGIDGAGLNPTDRALLRAIIRSGGHAGLNTLAGITGEEEATITETVEPFLLRRGFLTRSSRGRVATPSAYLLGLA